MKQGIAIIIGAGPAGLTAAIEFQRSSSIHTIVVESTREIGGISRTVRYKGNRMDIGGHRFFSKSDRVMEWWLKMMPLQKSTDGKGKLRYQGMERELPVSGAGADPCNEDLVMLVRQRKSRIYFMGRFFDYPVRLSARTLRNMGALRSVHCGLSYLRSVLLPQRKEDTLEDFLINRFGKQLYLMFFKSYTEKVWGVPCNQISAEWGAQRIKGLSLKGVAAHFFSRLSLKKRVNDIAQKETETSLIEYFLYPKFGPGQLWEHVAEQVQTGGGEIHLGITVDRICLEGDRITAIEGVNEFGKRSTFHGDYFISTMPVRDLIRAMGSAAPPEVKAVSEALVYRDFVTVGLLVSNLFMKEKDGSPIRDNWIYIQEPGVTVGRLQIFNNWSPHLVADAGKVWIGLEYFCNETDAIWNLSDQEMTRLAIKEAEQIGILSAADVEDSHVVRVPKSYPAYFGSYSRFNVVRDFTDSLENLFLVGRNGMHKYNNQDHSMLTAITAVENIVNEVKAKENIWAINTEMEYHEQRAQQ